MSKELREMMQRLEALKGEARGLLSDNKVDEAEAKMAEVRALQKKIDVQRSLEDADRHDDNPPAGTERNQEQSDETEYRDAFMKLLRRRSLTTEERSLLEQRAMKAGVGEDGGLIVPQDITTRIHELMRARIDLSQYVNVEPVTTLTGSRVIEKDADMVPFGDIEEMVAISDTDNPKFVPVTYAVKAKGGILPVSNTLLQDTDQTLMSYLTRWIAKKSVTTRNKLVLDLLATLTKVALADTDAIKTALNVTLDADLALGAIILTNQDGFNYLDTLKDSDGKYLLQPDITRPGQKLLFGKPVVVAPNKVLLTDKTDAENPKAPMIIGNLRELITLFDRQTYEIKATDVGGDSFKRNSTDIRVIMRQDIKLIDSAAAIYGQVAIPA